MKIEEVRSIFLEYFKNNGHTVVPSSNLLPRKDPTILFTNAGMNQFKDVFLGLDTRKYKKAVSCQKCVRAGGKHNDLENVGFTYRHHTFFEMLGNFSFGDYFKKDAIKLAWELLTKNYNIPEEKLFVTVYKDDDEAYKIWNNDMGLAPNKISRFGDKDNFWSMGDTGPCGPCSEIFYDHGVEHGCGKENCKVGCDCDRFVEIWNLVFMQYNRDEKGNLNPLPNPSIDTGAGLERLTAVMQGVASNYDIDVFKEIKKEISKDAKIGLDNKKFEPSYNAVADHLRGIAFLVADGCFPSNEGQGYVLRRIIRRAIRHAKVLGFDAPALYKKISVVIKLMGNTYPILLESEKQIINILRSEEDKFYETLDKGLSLLEKELTVLKEGSILAGAVAFKLYDTYGFPLDLTQLICKEKGFNVDEAGFNIEMEKQRQMARTARSNNQQDTVISSDNLELLKKHFEEFNTEFVGYTSTSINSNCVALIREGKFVDKLEKGQEGIVIFSKTPFYAESGGQISDLGTVVKNGKIVANVSGVLKPVASVIIQTLNEVKENIIKGQYYELFVSNEIRNSVERNHTATHMLHYLLRKHLGDHVKQAGSLVSQKFLSFDFSHYEKISEDLLYKIEQEMNEWIFRSEPVVFDYTSLDNAQKSGVVALFDEKYGDEVRVVKVGNLSAELCGGTHVKNTSEIGIFTILSEESTGAGVRRIRATTSYSAYEELANRTKYLKTVTKILKCSEPELEDKALQILSDNKELRKDNEKLKADTCKNVLNDAVNNISEIKGHQMLISELNDSNIKMLKDGVDHIRAKNQNTIISLYSEFEGQLVYVTYVPKQLTSKIKANELLQQLSVITGGKGGGSPEFAQGGGGDIARKKTIKETIESFLSNKLGG